MKIKIYDNVLEGFSKNHFQFSINGCLVAYFVEL